MALITNNPITIDGVIFNNLALTMAISPIWNGASVDGSISIVFTRYRKDELGNVEKLDASFDKPLVISSVDDLVIGGDTDVAQAARGVFAAIQAYINAKGI